MTELNINRDTESLPPKLTPQRKPSTRWRRAGLAGFLSLFVPGTGQLYNRQPRKALLLALSIPAVVALAVKTRTVFSFVTMVAFLVLLIAWRLFIAGEAAYGGWRKKPESAPPHARLSYPLIAVVLLFMTLYPPYNDFKRWTSFAAFKVSSASMCPTICSGERIVADLSAYRSKPPERGDLILLQHKSSPALFIKRVVGLPGDTVGPSPNGTIFVNGKTLIFPEACGTPVHQTYDPAGYSMFKFTTVPEGTFFVVGDNLGNSLDSRIPEFGPVVLGDVRGKPIFLYWSSSRSRIGCTIH